VPERITGHVARLITDNELLINVGASSGVKVGLKFAVLDTRTNDVTDPVTGEDLGSLRRVKTNLVVVQVGDRISLAREVSSRSAILSSLSATITGYEPSASLTGTKWSSGVAVGDPVQSEPTAVNYTSG
jgi:hypothetical protein